MVASQRRPALFGEPDSCTAAGAPGANPKASITSLLSARHNHVRLAMSGCGMASVKSAAGKRQAFGEQMCAEFGQQPVGARDLGGGIDKPRKCRRKHHRAIMG